jgi:MFS transporter, BCD family, chlorophyll transporter
MSAPSMVMTRASATPAFGIVSVLRLGAVQACLGALVVIITATINRVMVNELALPAMVPGLLVGLHYAVQLGLRPRMGHFADRHGHLGRWILLGMTILAVSVVSITALLPLVQRAPVLGFSLLVLAFIGVGLGVSTAGTLLLTVLSLRVEPVRHARAAATVWLCMIVGFILCTVVGKQLLEPFSYPTLTRFAAIIGTASIAITALALEGLPTNTVAARDAAGHAIGTPFADAVRTVWNDATARRFTLFVGLSMLAYSTQDLILEPFAGSVFGLTPAESTAISGVHQGGSLVGMLLTAFLSTRIGSLAAWARGGCIGSAIALLLIAASPASESVLWLKGALFGLGVGNGVFAIGAIGSMMSLSTAAGGSQTGVRMGVFGAAQAVAMAAGGVLGAGASDVMRAVLGSDQLGYGSVFAFEAALFLGAAVLASAARDAGRARSMDSMLAAAN